jgi:hypothetical protein
MGGIMLSEVDFIMRFLHTDVVAGGALLILSAS